MLGLTKKTDYGLLALSHLARSQHGRALRTREIAEVFGIPVELLAKIMQRLARSGLVSSMPGPTGGYALARPAQHISIGDVIESIEGMPAIVACLKSDASACDQHPRCTIRRPLERVNARVYSMLCRIPLSELALEDELERPFETVAGIVPLASIRPGCALNTPDPETRTT